MLFNSALRTRRAAVFLSVIFMKRIFPLTQLIIRFDCFILRMRTQRIGESRVIRDLFVNADKR